MKIMEIWLHVKGYEGKYEVSNFGRVKSLKRTRVGKGGGIYGVKEKILKCGRKGSYDQAAIHDGNGKRKYALVHRLVAEAFLPNPEIKPCINHKNGIKTDNRIENLEWATYSENSIHAIKNGLFVPEKGSERFCAKLNEKIVLGIKLRIKNGHKLKDIAKEHKLNPVTISNIKTGTTWKHVLV